MLRLVLHNAQHEKLQARLFLFQENEEINKKDKHIKSPKVLHVFGAFVSY